MRVALVSAESFEFDSRGLQMCRALAADGHDVTVLALREGLLPLEEELGPRLRVIRVDVDRRITSALRPLPRGLRAGIARVLRLDPEAMILPSDPPQGVDRLRHPFRRALELAAHARRAGPWAEAVVRAAPDADVLQTKALPALPVVRAAAAQLEARYVYDFADYQTEAARLARLPWVIRAAARRLERRWVRDAAATMAASPDMAGLVARRFGAAQPLVVLNCPPTWRPGIDVQRTTLLGDRLGLAPDRPIVLYHGQLKPDRGIEELVAVADEPSLRDLNVALVFMGFGRLAPSLDEVARRHRGRVYTLPGVPFHQLLDHVSGADVGYLGCPPRTLNLRVTLPSKLFECLMAGVPVLAASGTAQARLIERERVGVTTTLDSARVLANALAELLNSSSFEREEVRRHCRSVALRRYTWERNAPVIVDLYRGLADEKSPRSNRTV